MVRIIHDPPSHVLSIDTSLRIRYNDGYISKGRDYNYRYKYQNQNIELVTHQCDKDDEYERQKRLTIFMEFSLFVSMIKEKYAYVKVNNIVTCKINHCGNKYINILRANNRLWIEIGSDIYEYNNQQNQWNTVNERRNIHFHGDTMYVQNDDRIELYNEDIFIGSLKIIDRGWNGDYGMGTNYEYDNPINYLIKKLDNNKIGIWHIP